MVVDCETLFRSVQATYGHGARVAYRKLRDTVLDGTEASCIHLIAYVSVKSGKYGQMDFMTILSNLGFVVRPLQCHFDPTTGQVTREDVIERLQYETLDFTCQDAYPATIKVVCGSVMLQGLYEALRARGSRTTVVGFGKAVSSELYGVERHILGEECLLPRG